MNYEKWKTKLMAVSAVSDPAKLDLKLPGRSKYAPSTLAPLPFEGISVIHNIDVQMAGTIGLSQMANELKLKIAGAGLTKKIAFVDTHSFHVTTFDLLNEPEHGEKITTAGRSYPVVRQAVEEAAAQFLHDVKLQLVATVKITGIGMFSPNVVKLNLRFHDVVTKVFQTFRLELHRYLLENVEGYSVVRGENWNSSLAGHITFAYIIDSMAEKQIDALIDVLKEFNERFEPIEFECTQGEVTAFSDMDHYVPV